MPEDLRPCHPGPRQGGGKPVCSCGERRTELHTFGLYKDRSSDDEEDVRWRADNPQRQLGHCKAFMTQVSEYKPTSLAHKQTPRLVYSHAPIEVEHPQAAPKHYRVRWPQLPYPKPAEAPAPAAGTMHPLVAASVPFLRAWQLPHPSLPTPPTSHVWLRPPCHPEMSLDQVTHL